MGREEKETDGGCRGRDWGDNGTEQGEERRDRYMGDGSRGREKEGRKETEGRSEKETLAARLRSLRSLTTQKWARIMSRCLAVTCASAPDVAYAVEYGRHFCRRAGVPDVQFTMPARFLLSQGGAYYK